MLQNFMTGCGFLYNETLAKSLEGVVKTQAQYKAIDPCGFNSAFIMAWVGLAFLIIIFLIAKKWLGEEEAFGMPYNWLTSALGILVYFLLVSFGMNSKWGLMLGLIGMLVGGFGVGMFFGGSAT